jgi:formate dehydrogenase subunit gamma
MLDSVEVTSRVGEILNAHKGMEGALLPILHAIQADFGYVPQDALPIIAQDLNLSRAEACQAMGADRVAAHAQKALGIEWHETTKDGAVTLEPVFCLGLCACAPAAIVDGKLIGRVDEARIDAIIGGLK